MKTNVTLDSIKDLSFAEYKKALKKDKKFLKKAKGVIFLNDYQFKDKKGLAVVLYKKPKDVKQAYKDVKKDGHPVPKMAAGACEYVEGDNGKELKVDIKFGGLAEDKIQLKGKAIFKPVLGLLAKFAAPNPEDNDGQLNEEESDSQNDLQDMLQAIKGQLPGVQTAIANYKNQEAQQEDADKVEDIVEDLKEWLVTFKNATGDVKAQMLAHAKKFKDQYVKLKALLPKIQQQADEVDPKTFMEKVGDKAEGFVDGVKEMMGDTFKSEEKKWEDDNIDEIEGEGSGGDTAPVDASELIAMRDELEAKRAEARTVLDQVEDLEEVYIDLTKADADTIKAYTKAAEDWLAAYDTASDEVKAAFNEQFSGYPAEIRQSHQWNALSFLPKVRVDGRADLESLRLNLETKRNKARQVLNTVEDLNAASVSLDPSQVAIIEDYIEEADDFLNEYETAPEEAKAEFDSKFSGYAQEIEESYQWNANDFLPRVGADSSGDGGQSSDEQPLDPKVQEHLNDTISASVGKGGTNKPEDVLTIRAWLIKTGGANIEMIETSDSTLENEIKKFQRRLGNSRPDGKVDPGYDTFKGLKGEIPLGPPSTAVSSVIQGGESGAAGYNAYNRGTKGNTILGAERPRSLVDMTLGEVMADQARDIDHPDKLFAVGKYQMIPQTLKEGVRTLNLDHSTKFSAEIQELLFSDYLMGKKRPAIRAYITGQGTAFDAQLAGAQEWASIAVPEGHAKAGKSYYDGVGGNSAHITADEFLSALDEAKAAYEKYIADGVDPDTAYRQAVSGVQETAESDAPDNGDDTAAGDTNTGDDNTPTDDSSTDDAGSDTNTDDGGEVASDLSGSVGKGGDNEPAEVRLVQTKLKEKGQNVAINGEADDATIAAIEAFQQATFGWKDGLVEAGGQTWGALNFVPGKYFSHPDAGSVSLSYGSKAVKLNAEAEALLKSLLAASGNTAGSITSTIRTYYDQARINLTQNTASQIGQWYGAEVLAKWRQYAGSPSTAQIQEYADWLQQRDENRGRVMSRHLSNQAIDVVPNNDRAAFAKFVRAQVSVSGSGVRRIIAKGELGEPVDHVEFTFKVTG